MKKEITELTDQNDLPESNTLIIRRLVKARGIWSAIFLPAIIVIIALILPFGNVATRSYILKLSELPVGKIFLFLMISLPIWYALHKILDWLKEINIYPKRRKLFIYLVAFAWTAHAIYILFLR